MIHLLLLNSAFNICGMARNSNNSTLSLLWIEETDEITQIDYY